MPSWFRVTPMDLRSSQTLKPSPPLSVTPATERSINLPNILTFSRILLIPVFVIIFATPTPERALLAGAIFGIAALTDLLDGYLARRRSEITKLGQLLDPIADKLLITSALVLLVQFQQVPAVVAILIIGREVAITWLRAVAASRGLVMSSESVGKYKMVLQVVSLLLLILAQSGLGELAYLQLLGTVLLYVALGLGLISGGQYLNAFWRHFSSKGI